MGAVAYRGGDRHQDAIGGVVAAHEVAGASMSSRMIGVVDPQAVGDAVGEVNEAVAARVVVSGRARTSRMA